MNKFASIAAILMLSACFPKVYKPDFTSNIEVQADATINVFGSEIDGSGWTGTGWYIASMGNTSVVATAGHVCNAPGDYLKFASVPIRVDKSSYKTSEGQAAYPIYDHDVEPDDVCLLFVNHAAPSVIRVAKKPANAGDVVHYVGYPDSIFGAYDGYVVGVDDLGYTSTSLPATGGASGAAVVNDNDEAIGMLVKGDPGFTNHDWLVPLADLQKAQDYADAFLYRFAGNPFDMTRAITDGTSIDRDSPIFD